MKEMDGHEKNKQRPEGGMTRVLHAFAFTKHGEVKRVRDYKAAGFCQAFPQLPMLSHY